MVKDFILEVIGYHVGVAFLHVVTFGSYPREPIKESHQTLIEALGILLIFIFLTILWLFLK